MLADQPQDREIHVIDRADVVFGSRFLVAEERRVLYFWHALANHALTTLANGPAPSAKRASYEVPISYHGRTYAEGKKIGFWDAVQALCS